MKGVYQDLLGLIGRHACILALVIEGALNYN